MAAPINNNLTSTLTTTQSRTDRLEQGGDPGKGQQAQALPQATDAVTLSRAAEVLNSVPPSRGEGAIHSPEQASNIAQNLSALFTASPAQALATQSGDTSGLGEILRVG